MVVFISAISIYGSRCKDVDFSFPRFPINKTELLNRFRMNIASAGPVTVEKMEEEDNENVCFFLIENGYSCPTSFGEASLTDLPWAIVSYAEEPIDNLLTKERIKTNRREIDKYIKKLEGKKEKGMTQGSVLIPIRNAVILFVDAISTGNGK